VSVARTRAIPWRTALGIGFFQTLAAVAALLIIVGTSVGTWAALRTGRQSQIIKNYRDAANSWREKSEAQEAETKQLRTELDDNKRLMERYQVRSEARISELETQLTILQNIVTGREEFDYLNSQVKSLKEDTGAILTLLRKA